MSVACGDSSADDPRANDNATANKNTTANGNGNTNEPPESEPARVVVFTKTTGFRHRPIPDGRLAMEDIASDCNIELVFTEGAAVLTEELTSADAVVFSPHQRRRTRRVTTGGIP